MTLTGLDLFTPDQAATLRAAWEADSHFWFLVRIYADDIQAARADGEAAADGLRWLATLRQRPNLDPSQGGRFYWYIPDDDQVWSNSANPAGDPWRNWLPRDFRPLHCDHGELTERLGAAVGVWLTLPRPRREELWDSARAAAAGRPGE